MFFSEEKNQKTLQVLSRSSQAAPTPELRRGLGGGSPPSLNLLSLLTSPRFRSWAARFPLTRPIARRRARAVFDLCAGFVYTQVLQACVRLKLFDMLAEGPQTGAALAARMGLAPEPAERLLAAAASLKLVSRRRATWALGPLGAALINNDGIAAMVAHHAVLYADLQDPVALLRGESAATGLATYWGYAAASRPAQLDEAQVAPYSALMAASQPMIAEEVLHAYRLGRHRRLLDVGGGDGSFAAAAAAQHPKLEVILFDLPAVAARAEAWFHRARLGARAAAVGGDFLHGDLPQGADVASLVRVIHDHDDTAALTILRAVYRALPPRGTLLLAEPMAGTPGAEPAGDAYFGFYLLAMRSGRPRTPDELMAMLRQAGFAHARLARTNLPMLTRLIVATRA